MMGFSIDPLNQFAIRNSQFAITFCNGDLTPTQNVLPIEAGDLNPQSLLISPLRGAILLEDICDQKSFY
jgi:hypothetical protein